MKRNLFGLSLFFLIIVLLNACFWKSDYGFETKLFPVKAGDKWGYIDHKGKYVINPQFEDAGLFRCGLARIENSDGKIGFINEKGNYVILPNYIDATPFSSDVAFVVEEGGHITCIDKKGNEKFKLQEAKRAKWFTEGLAAFVNKDGKWGFVDKSGEIVINPQFDNVHPFREGLAAVCNKDGQWGFIDKSGALVINYQFEQVDDFSEGLAAFSNGDKCGYVSKKGEYAINPQFDGAFRFHSGKAAVSQGKLVGFIDKKGQYVINPQFDIVIDPTFMDGLAAVSSGDKAGFIDEKGKYVINPQFEYTYPFIDGLAAVACGNQIGFIDKKGKYVINPQFKEVFTDLYELFPSIAPYVVSDYYNADEFVKRLLERNATTTCFDTFCAKSTLKIISERTKYEKASLYSRSVIYSERQNITDDIDISSVHFYFDSDTYYYDYWNYERHLNETVPISAICYRFDLNGDAIGKGNLIAKALKKGFAHNYDISFNESSKDKNISFEAYEGDEKLSFVILANQYSCELWVGTSSDYLLKDKIKDNSYFRSEFERDIVVEEEEMEEPAEEEAVVAE